MQDLRLVGVHEDGQHLLLSGDGSSTYRLRIDEALRTAAARPTARPSTRSGEGRAAAMPPRDIQARIRAGATVEEVAEESGLEIAHVRRYEGPVRAERDYMARLAQQVEVAPAVSTHEAHRSAFVDYPASLGEMVAHRLPAFGVKPTSVQWDSWRRPDGAWDVVARFELGPEATVSIGEEPPAKWIYSPTRRTVTNANRWAQVLSELEPLDGPLPARRLSAVADHVFDFEAEREPEATPKADPENLLEVLRSRRGQRLGVDEDADDALALMLSRGAVPAAHPREAQAHPQQRETQGRDVQDGDDAQARTGADAAQDQPARPGRGPADRPAAAGPEPVPAAHDDGGLPALAAGVSTNTTEITIPASMLRPAASAGKSPARRPETPDPADSTPAAGKNDGDAAAEAQERTTAEADTTADRPAEPPARKGQEERKPIKPKRSSVPSWDEIVFGTKGD